MNTLQISEEDRYKLQAYLYDRVHNKDLLNFLKQRNQEDSDDYAYYYRKYVKSFVDEDMFKQYIVQKYFHNKGIPVKAWYLDFYEKELQYISL